MKNTFGQAVSVTLYGESHGAEIGVVLDGLSAGIPIDEDRIRKQLALRRPSAEYETARREADEFSIVSGVFRGKTTGTPITIRIPNTQTDSRQYEAIRGIARPSHADYTGYCRYHGYEDYRGGGHFSGRVTVGLVAAGAIALTALEGKGIQIGTHISRCGGIADRPFHHLKEDIAALQNTHFPVLDTAQAEAMQAILQRAKQEGDSVGGELETVVLGFPSGIGEPWFDTVEGVLAHGLFSIPAVKGVSFGAGFAFSDGYGSQMNDAFRMEQGRIVTTTNYNGGVNGGISNGMPLQFRCAVKPTPSIYQKQQTVNFMTGEAVSLALQGRHDPTILTRARVVVDSVTALVLCDLLEGHFGVNYFQEEVSCNMDV